MTDKVNDFLVETEVRNSTEGLWGIGTKLGRGTAKAVLYLMSVQSATDQLLISANRENVLPIVAETLGKVGLLKDPALFDIPTATFAVLMGRSWPALGVKSKPCLVFVTLKAVSENSTHVLIEGYSRSWGLSVTSAELKRVRDEISARFR